MISWAAMNRVVERKMASDPKYRKYSGRPVRSDARNLSDEELLSKLRFFGVRMDRSSLESLSATALSAQEISTPLLDRLPRRQRTMESDWVWICLTELWERWFPDKPCFELLDDKIEAGYAALAERDASAVCRIWLDAWSDALGMFHKSGLHSIQELNERFGGTKSLFNWIQDFEGELWNAGLKDRQYLRTRIALAEEALRRSTPKDDRLIENSRRAIAESYDRLGDTDKAESLYRGWLEDDPRWGWGWIGWSDCFRFTSKEAQDWNRCEQILREGFSVQGVRDREDIADRLADACEELGRPAEAEGLRAQVERRGAAAEALRSVRLAEKAARKRNPGSFLDAGLPLSGLTDAVLEFGRGAPAPVTSQKIGRNEPCPCGSGKKYKKCCGA